MLQQDSTTNLPGAKMTDLKKGNGWDKHDNEKPSPLSLSLDVSKPHHHLDNRTKDKPFRSLSQPTRLADRGVLEYVQPRLKRRNETVESSNSSKIDTSYYLKSSVRVGLSRKDPCDLTYELHGEGTKHKILFIMGLCMSKELWEPQVRYFVEQEDYQVCIVDNRGHGDSRASTFYASTSTFAWDFYELLTHLRWEHVHIVGLSMGGMIAQELSYIIQTQREHNPLSVRLASLTLSATHSGGLFGYLIPLSGIPYMIRWILSLTPYQKTHHLMPFCYSKSFLKDNYEDLLDWHLDIYRTVHLRTLISHLCAVFGHYVSYARLNVIKEGKFPILIVTGTDDKLVRARNSSILASALQTEYVVLEGCGHLLNCELATEFNKLLHQHVNSAAHKDEAKKIEEKQKEKEKQKETEKDVTQVRRWIRIPSVKGIVMAVWGWVIFILLGLLSIVFSFVGRLRWKRKATLKNPVVPEQHQQSQPQKVQPQQQPQQPQQTLQPQTLQPLHQSQPQPQQRTHRKKEHEKSKDKTEPVEEVELNLPPTQNPPRAYQKDNTPKSPQQQHRQQIKMQPKSPQPKPEPELKTEQPLTQHLKDNKRNSTEEKKEEKEKLPHNHNNTLNQSLNNN